MYAAAVIQGMVQRSMNEVLHRLPPLDPRELLTRLAQMASRGEETPDLTLLLASGGQLSGHLLALSEGSNPCVLLATERNQTASAAYVPLSQVVGVVVPHARSCVQMLSFGALDALPQMPPTRPGLRREIAERTEKLAHTLQMELASGVDVEHFPDTPESLWSLSLAVRDLAEAMTRVAESARSADELRRQVKRVAIQPAEHPNLTLQNGSLLFEIAPQQGPKGRLTVAALHERIAKLL